MYCRCLKGFNPLGPSRVDNERSQISNTTSHIKDYARGYAGYWQSKVKDAAPSAWWGIDGSGLPFGPAGLYQRHYFFGLHMDFESENFSPWSIVTVLLPR